VTEVCAERAEGPLLCKGNEGVCGGEGIVGCKVGKICFSTVI
jgi:hypothetical protein